MQCHMCTYKLVVLWCASKQLEQTVGRQVCMFESAVDSFGYWQEEPQYGDIEDGCVDDEFLDIEEVCPGFG
jgi:hypothetical protein